MISIELCHKCYGVVCWPEGMGERDLDSCSCISQGSGLYCRSVALAALAQCDRCAERQELFDTQGRHPDEPVRTSNARTWERARVVLRRELRTNAARY